MLRSGECVEGGDSVNLITHPLAIVIANVVLLIHISLTITRLHHTQPPDQLFETQPLLKKPRHNHLPQLQTPIPPTTLVNQKQEVRLLSTQRFQLTGYLFLQLGVSCLVSTRLVG